MDDVIKNQYEEYTRLYTPIFIEQEFLDFTSRLPSQLERAMRSEHEFEKVFFDNKHREAFLCELRNHVRTKDLLDQHRRLQEVLFPALMLEDIFDTNSCLRKKNYYLQLFTYPESFRKHYKTHKDREKAIQTFKVNIETRKQKILLQAELIAKKSESS